MGGQLSFAGFAAYSATKFALEGMSEALAEEVRPLGVKVLIVEPGAFRTALFANITASPQIADYAASVPDPAADPDRRPGRRPRGDSHLEKTARDTRLGAEPVSYRRAGLLIPGRV